MLAGITMRYRISRRSAMLRKVTSIIVTLTVSRGESCCATSAFLLQEARKKKNGQRSTEANRGHRTVFTRALSMSGSLHSPKPLAGPTKDDGFLYSLTETGDSG